MCIRDRYDAALEKLKVPSAVYDDLTLSEYWGDKNRIFNCCLLYTSDAADERSSVDLGGRRIIKKKNNSTIYGDTHHKLKTKNYLKDYDQHA